MDPLIGRELEGRYRLVAALGEGAMGRVYRADRLDGTGQVAVKVLTEDCSENPDLRERFEREARALFGLSHPHILDVQDYGVIDGRQPFLVMELLSGRTLEALVEESTLDPALALELGRQLLSGLAFSHSQGVLHRDLKTENIFVVTGEGERLHAKLLDFGLVKFVDDDRWGEGRKLTVAGSVFGSPAYMSPEQGTGGAMDARSDVYSAGVVLYELLTGTWPYVGESRMEMLKAHLLNPIPKLADGRPGLRARPELDAVIAKALAKDADDRFTDANAMLAALSAIPSPAAWLDAAPPKTPSWTPAGMPPPAAPPTAPVPSYGAPVPAYGAPAPPIGAAPSAFASPMHSPPAPMAPSPMAPSPMAPSPMAPLAAPIAPAPSASSGGTKIALLVAGGLVAFCLLSGIVATVVALVLD
ncbi:MAG: serine/threonine protein kinase [Sandaracinaceae bacterium]|nr:serine/threonine protein kinase [Sandaracinaceae bacterium]